MEASNAEELPRTRDTEGTPKYRSSGGDLTSKLKEKERSLDMEERPRPPREVRPGTNAYRAANHNSRGQNLLVKTDQYLSISIYMCVTTLAMSIKEESNAAREKKEVTELKRRDRTTKIVDQPIKFVEHEVTMEGCRLDLLTN